MVDCISHSKINLAVLFIFFLPASVLLFCPNTAKAESSNPSWSWIGDSPTVAYSKVAPEVNPMACPTAYQMKNIEGELAPRNVCITEGKKIKFGNTYYSQWGFEQVISFAYDSKVYKFRGPCGYYDSCIYMPGSDTLVTKQYLINGYARSLVVYKNFMKRLRPKMNQLSLEYNFDDSNPEYIFRSDEGYAWPVGGFGASNDGNWLGVEIRQRGIGLFNIETLEMRRISYTGFSYGLGRDPSTEIAVSNGGRQVAVMGINSGLSVYDIDSNCGDIATDYTMKFIASVDNLCKTANISAAGLISPFLMANLPRFSEDGGELSFYVSSYWGEAREISLRAAGYFGQRLDYLALGDSFTSGEGEDNDKYYLQGTNDKFEKCHVSTRSYPYLIAELSNISPSYVRSVACSGAVTDDVIGEDKDYWGQGGRLGEKNLNLDKVDKALAQTQARLSYSPGRIHQESFVATYKPKIITIGIGGNDAGFMEKLKACIGSDTCSWAINDEDKEQTAIEIKNLFGTLVKTYQKIHAQSPTSSIYAVGYPKVIDDDGDCGLVLGKLLDKTEKKFMNEGIMYLNQIIEAAAKKVGIKYVNIQESYGDQVLCGKSRPEAMNGIRTGDDGAISNSLNWAKVIGNESFHPNPLGHSLSATSIIESLDDLMTYDYCGGGLVICPHDATAPDPSKYWIPEKVHDYPTQKIATFLQDRDDSFDNRQKLLSLDGGSFAPNSTVSAEITSDVKPLGKFTSRVDGSLIAGIDLPIDLEEGFHTIHLYGTSYSGESVELYQVIEYSRPKHAAEVPQTETVDTKKQAADNILNSTNTDEVVEDNDTIDYSGQDKYIPASLQQPAVKGASTSVESMKSKSAEPIDKGSDLQITPQILWIAIALSGFIFVVIWRHVTIRG